MIQLSGEEAKTIYRILSSHLRRGEVWLFGSRLNSKLVKKFSDVDLAFVGAVSLSSLEIENIKEQFSSSDLPFKVDLCNLVDLPLDIQRSIEQNHEVFYKVKSI